MFLDYGKVSGVNVQHLTGQLAFADMKFKNLQSAQNAALGMNNKNFEEKLLKLEIIQ